jgi:hypothetical protein
MRRSGIGRNVVHALHASERRVRLKTADLARVSHVGDVEDDRAADPIGEIRAVADDVGRPVHVVAVPLGPDARRDLLLGQVPVSDLDRMGRVDEDPRSRTGVRETPACWRRDARNARRR